jgi:hypothetical protein
VEPLDLDREGRGTPPGSALLVLHRPYSLPSWLAGSIRRLDSPTRLATEALAESLVDDEPGANEARDGPPGARILCDPTKHVKTRRALARE